MEDLQKIMLVEDEEDIRTVATFALEKRGKLTVKSFGSGQEALENVLNYNPQLILLDVMMPGMDGIATFKALRKMPELVEVPIIFMTAKAQQNEIAEYKALGAIEVISKPFDSSNLANQLREIWKKYHIEHTSST